MNRGRHRKKNISKETFLKHYGARNLEKWKDFTLKELERLVEETLRQQEDYAQKFGRPVRKCDLSLYERRWSIGMTEGGINWELTKEGHNEWCYLMTKLCK